MVAPPIGGALYDRFGFRAPFIFGMAVVVLDFFGRLLFIERKDAAIWLDNEKTDLQADTSMANVTPGWFILSSIVTLTPAFFVPVTNRLCCATCHYAHHY